MLTGERSGGLSDMSEGGEKDREKDWQMPAGGVPTKIDGSSRLTTEFR